MGRSYSARRQAQGKRHISLNARGLSRNTCRVAAMAHQGLRMQPSFLAGRTLGSTTLVESMPQLRCSKPGGCAVYPIRKHVSPRVRVPIDLLSRHCAQARPSW